MFRALFVTIFNLLIVANLTQAQSVVWGQEAKAFKSTGKIVYLGKQDGFMYNVEVKAPYGASIGGEIRLEKLSNDMNVVFSKELDEVQSEGLRTTHFVIQDNQLIVFNTGFDKSNKSVEVYQSVYDLKGGFIGKRIITTVELNNLNNITGNFSASPNGEIVIFLLTHTNLKEKRVDVYSINFDLLNDSKFNRADQSYKLEEEVEIVSIEAVQLDNFDNVYVVLKTKKRQYRSNVSKSILLIMDANGEFLISKMLKFKNFFMTQIGVKIANDNKVYFTGMLSTTTTNEKITLYKGFFLANINSSTFEFMNFKSFTYSEEFFRTLGYNIKESEIGLYGYHSLKLQLDKKSGGFLVASHVQYLEEIGLNDKEFLVLSFDENLEIRDSIVVPRSIRSYSNNYYVSKYFSFLIDTSLYLIYSDHEDNIKSNNVNDMKTLLGQDNKESNIYFVKIEPDNSVIRKVLSHGNDIKGYLIPDKCQYSDDKIIINVGNKSKTLYGEVKF